jgi:class 3 adenylate cyclase/predicted ATPase
MNIGDWLRGLGLERYGQAFRENDIDAAVLPSLTAEDLIGLGVSSIGHRRKLLDAIAALQVGASSETAPGPTPVPPLDPGPSRAERRQLTVMFCDLVGSTALSAQLDPEDLREVIGAYHNCVAEAVGGFDGFVAKYMGDGVLIYFGYPQAHENDAERAVMAALKLVSAVTALQLRSTVELACRVGIATGLVVVGDLVGSGEAQERGVVGETPNLAARLQSLAEPNAVMISDATRRLVGDLFEYRDLGAVAIRGLPEAVQVWQALGPSAVESRFEALRGSALTPLVGREEEIDLLLRRWARAKSGDGQVVLISGEPGIGKSRLTAALIERLHAEPYLRLRYFCSPYHQDSALFPFIDQLGRASGFAHDDPPVAKLRKLEALLSGAAPADDDVALLADLMSLPASKHHPLPNLSPQRKKERTLAALIRQLEGLVHQQPVLMVFEDAHWIDPTSRELLDLTIERSRSLSVLLIVTFRPEFQPQWTGQPRVTTLALNRLDRYDRTALIAEVAGVKALPDNVIDQIAERTDGVPLFVEELTKSVLEGVTLRIPTSLHDSLMARLDRSASVRHVAQIGAAIGREFSYQLLRAVSNLPEKELQAALARLVASELVFQRGTPPDAVCIFKHALVQDAAHGSLLRSARQQLHAQIAEALETHSPETKENQPELFAQHYEEAGLNEKAVEYWTRAGKRSAAQSALVETAIQLEKALARLALTPDGHERQQKELRLQADLGSIRFAVRGWAAPETGQSYARSRELWEQLGYPSEFLRVPWGQWMYHANRGDFDLGQRLAEDLLHRSQQHGQGSGLILARLCLGATLMGRGEFALSRQHLGEVDRLYVPGTHQALVQEAGVHPHTMSLTFLGFIHFCLGYPDQAVAYHTAAIEEARSEQHQPSVAQSLGMNVLLLSLLGDAAVLAEHAEQLFAIGVDQGFPIWRARGLIFRGWATVATGGFDDGISSLRAGVTAYEATGARWWTPHFHALQAEAEVIGGHPDAALGILIEALDTSRERGENWFEAELVRLRGQVLQPRNTAAAETIFEEAIGIAQRQEAKMWELRAAVSLARLRRDQSRRAEARDLLAPVYDWFTEGFDTPDLIAAKALLDELR